ncbi:alpha/beta-hydrolase, partial [Thozetella sp. PMI_491]
SINSVNNTNPPPSTTGASIYPWRDLEDPAYSEPESALLGAIYIPRNFTNCSKTVVILVPGTGLYGGELYEHNLAKLLKNVSYGDPVWLNIPTALLGDAQISAEYVAYAINYFSTRCPATKVAIVGASQGALLIQWVLTFWKSTRAAVSDFIAISADFHGSIIGGQGCIINGTGGLGKCNPATWQQIYTSNFVNSLRDTRPDGSGQYPWVNTSSIYTVFFDEVVQPQEINNATASLNDTSGAPVSNIPVQTVCPGQLPSFFWTHGGMLTNPVTPAVLEDALTYGGPANTSRINHTEICPYYIPQGLTLGDILITTRVLICAGLRSLSYQPKLAEEPSL